jgi:hypothetical protein
MKKRRRYNALLFVGLSIACAWPGAPTEAQGTFTYRAKLDTVGASGFYRIILTPELVAKCKPDLGDLRILGPDKRFVSYVLSYFLKDSWAPPDTTSVILPIPDAKMVQKDSSNKHSYISVEFPEAYVIDWVGLTIHSPVFYKRWLEILAEGNMGEWEAVTSTDIDPSGKFLRIPAVRTRRLRIDIANADNAPLVIGKVACFQTTRYLLAYLRAGDAYQLFTGNPQAIVPDYDLKYFTDSLKATPRNLSIESIQKIGSQDQPTVITPTVTSKDTTAGKNHSGLLLWSCLLAVLLFLVYFSVRMVKAIAKKDAHDRI